jgi:chromosome segregation ATPase
METMDIDDKGGVKPADVPTVATSVAPADAPAIAGTQPASTVSTASDPDTPTNDELDYKAIDFYERDWLGKIDVFKSEFIDGKDNITLSDLKTLINDKKILLNAIIASPDRKTKFMNEVNTAKKELNDRKKEVNQLEKAIARYESKMDELKRNTGEAAETSSKISELQREKDAASVERVSKDDARKAAEKTLEEIEYKRDYQDKAEATLKELNEILEYVTIKRDEKDISLRTAQAKQIVAVIKELDEQYNELSVFINNNMNKIVNAIYTESQLKEILRIIKKEVDNVDNDKTTYSYENLEYLYRELSYKYNVLLSDRITDPPLE